MSFLILPSLFRSQTLLVSAFEKKRNKSSSVMRTEDSIDTNDGIQRPADNETVRLPTQPSVEQHERSADNAASYEKAQKPPFNTTSSSYYRFSLDDYDVDVATNFGTTASIVNRYKMERKNSQSQTNKMVFNGNFIQIFTLNYD